MSTGQPPGIIDSHLRSMLQEGGDADIIDILMKIWERSGRRYTFVSLITAREDFIRVRAHESTQHRKRDVMVTITRDGSRHQLLRLAHIRDALGAANDPRIGLEFSSLSSEGPNERRWACLVSTYHERVVPLLTHVQNVPQSGVTIVALLHGMAEQLRALHDGGYSHGDVAASNFVVSADRTPHLVDLELCQPLQSLGNSLAIGGTPGFAHPRMLLLAAEKAGQGEIAKGDRIAWDVYVFGKTVTAVLNSVSPLSLRELTHYQQRALSLIATRCLDGTNRPAEVALGLTPRDYQSLRFTSIDDVLDSLEKIGDPFSLVSGIPELDQSVPDRIQASAFAALIYTPRLKGLLQSSSFGRLTQINQLGLIELVYPTAHHARSEHALGTYALTCEYVRWLLRDDVNPLFAQLMTPRDIRRLIVASLLHDIGHYPLAHDFEEADRKLFDHERRS